MRNNLLEAFMGAVVLIIASIFLIIIYRATDSHSGEGYLLNGSFSRVDGLVQGSDVKVGGVKVGTVTKIYIDPQSYQATVTFRVNNHIQLPDDTSGEINSESLLGGKYLDLVPGGSPTFLKEGDSLEYTRSALSLEGLITKFIANQGNQSTPAQVGAQGMAQAS